MYPKTFLCMLFWLLFVFLTGCTSGGDAQPILPEEAPELKGSGHVVLFSGTLGIDLEGMKVVHMQNGDDPIHERIDGIIDGYLDAEIIDVNPDQVTLRMKMVNPYRTPLYDLRIIFTNLFDKSIVNPDGYTNFYTSVWNTEFNPFIFFAKEYPYNGFPAGPEAFDDETVTMSWHDGVLPKLSYIVECSLDGNINEPHSISDITLHGDLTPCGGAAIIQCSVSDWQDDVKSVKILANEFYDEDVKMFVYQDADIYLGNLVNLLNVTPGEHTVWIEATSENPDGLAYRMPITVSVPDTSEEAPGFSSMPRASLQYDYYALEQRHDIQVQLDGRGKGDVRGDLLDYLWEQLSPAESVGIFGRTGESGATTHFYLDDLTDNYEMIFKLSVKNPNYDYISNSLVYFPTEEEEFPEIVEGPIHPAEMLEREWTILEVKAIDPNRPDDDSYLSYEWKMNFEDQGYFAGGNNTGKRVHWRASHFNEDTIVKMQVRVTKDTGYYRCKGSKNFEIKVIDVGAFLDPN